MLGRVEAFINENTETQIGEWLTQGNLARKWQKWTFSHQGSASVSDICCFQDHRHTSDVFAFFPNLCLGAGNWSYCWTAMEEHLEVTAGIKAESRGTFGKWYRIMSCLIWSSTGHSKGMTGVRLERWPVVRSWRSSFLPWLLHFSGLCLILLQGSWGHHHTFFENALLSQALWPNYWHHSAKTRVAFFCRYFTGKQSKAQTRNCRLKELIGYSKNDWLPKGFIYILC